jgi:hypothetical protein
MRRGEGADPEDAGAAPHQQGAAAEGGQQAGEAA